MFADTNFAALCPDVKVAEYCLSPPADGICCGICPNTGISGLAGHISLAFTTLASIAAIAIAPSSAPVTLLNTLIQADAYAIVLVGYTLTGSGELDFFHAGYALLLAFSSLIPLTAIALSPPWAVTGRKSPEERSREAQNMVNAVLSHLEKGQLRPRPRRRKRHHMHHKTGTDDEKTLVNDEKGRHHHGMSSTDDDEEGRHHHHRHRWVDDDEATLVGHSLGKGDPQHRLQRWTTERATLIANSLEKGEHDHSHQRVDDDTATLVSHSLAKGEHRHHPRRRKRHHHSGSDSSSSDDEAELLPDSSSRRRARVEEVVREDPSVFGLDSPDTITTSQVLLLAGFFLSLITWAFAYWRTILGGATGDTLVKLAQPNCTPGLGNVALLVVYANTLFMILAIVLLAAMSIMNLLDPSAKCLGRTSTAEYHGSQKLVFGASLLVWVVWFAVTFYIWFAAGQASLLASLEFGWSFGTTFSILMLIIPIGSIVRTYRAKREENG